MTLYSFNSGKHHNIESTNKIKIQVPFKEFAVKSRRRTNETKKAVQTIKCPLSDH